MLPRRHPGGRTNAITHCLLPPVEDLPNLHEHLEARCSRKSSRTSISWSPASGFLALVNTLSSVPSACYARSDCPRIQKAVHKVSLASPSVTFVLSFFGGSPLHKSKGILLPIGGVRGAPSRKTTLVSPLYCCAWMVTEQVSHFFVRVRREVPRGLPGTHKIVCPKRTF